MLAAEVGLGTGLLLFEALVRGGIPTWLIQNLAVSMPAFGVLPFWILRRNLTFGPELLWKLGSGAGAAGFCRSGSFVILHRDGLVLEVMGNLVTFRGFIAADGSSMRPGLADALRWCRAGQGRTVPGYVGRGRQDHELAPRVERLRDGLRANWGLLRVMERRLPKASTRVGPAREATLMFFIPKWREQAEAIGDSLGEAKTLLDEAAAKGLPKPQVRSVPQLLAPKGKGTSP